MAVQFDYLAPKRWKPKNPDENFVITLLKVELDEKAVRGSEIRASEKRTEKKGQAL